MIDLVRLPPRVLVDTNVLIRALGERQDSESVNCAEFMQAMTVDGRETVIAAPTLSEVLRFGLPTSPPPNLAGANVVAFDAKAADILGRKFPQSVFVEQRSKTGIVAGYYKYDALIVACALRWQIPVVVALDQGVHSLCQHVGLAHYYPAYFQQAQLPQGVQAAAPN